MSEIVHVAVAVIRNAAGQVFITLRPDHAHQGGLWEFPGGKVEPGESVYDALVREIHEENGIHVQHARPLIKFPFQYPDKRVLLDVWQVVDYHGIPHGREGQVFRWVSQDDLGNYQFPAANLPILHAVSLPSLYLITPEPGDDDQQFLLDLEARLLSGLSLVQLRSRRLDDQSYCELAVQVMMLCRRYQALLMLNTSEALFKHVSADGLHLTSQRLMQLSARPIPRNKWLAASCHSLEEIAKARTVGVDFIVLGPVQVTASHPDANPLGWEAFSRLAASAAMPVYALGGMSVADVKQSRECGGQGIAAISGLWSRD